MKSLSIMKTAPAAVIIMVALGLFGCSGESSTEPSGELVRFSATVTVSECPFWTPVLGPYTSVTGKTAFVYLNREDGLGYMVPTDYASQATTYIDTGMYEVSIETFHEPRRTWGEPLHITSDTAGLEFLSTLTYNPSDSVYAVFVVASSDTVVAIQQEQHALQLLADLAHGQVDVSTAHRVTSERQPGIATWEQIAVRQGRPAWSVLPELKAVIDAHPNLFPSHFYVTGYVRACMY